MTERSIITSVSRPLFYRRTGAGPAMVLLHGFPATGNLWREVTGLLSQSFTLLIPDLPGAGKSRLDGEAITKEEAATAVKELLDDAGFEQAILTGHSMGGYIALALAHKYPARIDGLALIHSTAAADDADKKAMRQKTIDLIRKGGKSGFVREFVPTLFGEEFKKNYPDKVAAQAEESAAIPDASMIAFYTAMMNRPDYLKALSEAAFPVQWVVGGMDSVIPPSKVMQQTYLSAVSFVSMYPTAGHMSMLECPAALSADLQAFGSYCARRGLTMKRQQAAL